MRGTAFTLAAVAGVALGACSTSNVVEAPHIPDEARTATRIPRYPTWLLAGPASATDPPFRWSPGVVPIEARRVFPMLTDYHRLMVAASDGTATDSFMIDTGSSASTLSTSSPLARSLRFAAKPTPYASSGPPLHVAGRASVSTRLTYMELGVFDHLRLGDAVEGRDVPFAARSEGGSRANPKNIVGLNLLQTCALSRSDEGWRLETGPRAPWPAASTATLEAKGLPVVAMHDANGARIRAIVDAGAPWCIAFATAGAPPFGLRASDGREVLEITRTRDGGEVASDQRRFGGVEIDLILGVDALDRGTWRIDFERGVWEFAR